MCGHSGWLFLWIQQPALYVAILRWMRPRRLNRGLWLIAAWQGSHGHLRLLLPSYELLELCNLISVPIHHWKYLLPACSCPPSPNYLPKAIGDQWKKKTTKGWWLLSYFVFSRDNPPTQFFPKKQIGLVTVPPSSEDTPKMQDWLKNKTVEMLTVSSCSAHRPLTHVAVKHIPSVSQIITCDLYSWPPAHRMPVSPSLVSAHALPLLSQ